MSARGLDALLNVTPSAELLAVIREGREAILALQQIEARQPGLVIATCSKSPDKLQEMIRRNLEAEVNLGGGL